jgi:hypothetical protein
MEHETEELSRVESLTEKIRSLQHELEVEYSKRRAGLRFGIERGRAVFEAEILRRHRELRVGLFAYIATARLRVVLTAPFIYGLIVPFVLLDVCVSIYQEICFPAYGIPKVKRSEYFIFDRNHLAYLNILQKLNCAYCSYANGLIRYVREIGGRTEEYWCPIKHARRVIYAHEQYATFAEYGDAEAFRKKHRELRNKAEHQKKH